MKLENCGRCGLEPVIRLEEYALDDGPATEFACCPARHSIEQPDRWNAAQFAARTKRINAAAVAIHCAGEDGHRFFGAIRDAAELVENQDAAARVRWAEMQGK